MNDVGVSPRPCPKIGGNVSGQLKQFLDTLGGLWPQGLLADEVFSGLAHQRT